jgi:hypothetical protein
MIVLHIGLRKAGSSSIQSFLSANGEALSAQGVEYPIIGRTGTDRTAHVNLVHDLKGSGKFIPAYGSLEDLADHWRASSASTLILSSEMFEACDREDAVRMREILRRGNEPFRIVLILRPLTDLMASSYGQKVKYGAKTFDFDRFFARRIAEPRVDFHRTAQEWAGAFGWDSLRLRYLHRDHLLNGDLIDDFLALADVEDRDLMRTPPTNVTPGWRVLEAVRGLFTNRHGLPPDHLFAEADWYGDEQRRTFGNLAMAVGERCGWNAERGHYLTRAQAERCHAIYAKAISALNRTAGVSLPIPDGIFAERPFLPSADHIPPRDLRDFYDQVAIERTDHEQEHNEEDTGPAPTALDP